MSGQRQEMRTGTAKTVTMDRYLARTIFGTETGAVRSSWSVFVFLSSAKLLMVRTGMPIITIVTMPDNV